MPVKIRLTNPELALAATPEEERIVVNDLPVESKDDLEMVERLTLSTYDSNDVDFIAACSCGEKKGNYLIGTMCDLCDTEVTDPWKLPEPKLVIKSLADDMPFVNPHFWGIMSRVLVKSGYDVLFWMTNSRARPPAKTLPILQLIKDRVPGFRRDYRWFIQNMRTVLEIVLSIPAYASTSRDKVKHFLKLLKEMPDDAIFTHVLPIPTKRLLVVEKSNKGRYIDYNIGYIRDAVNSAAVSKLTVRNDIDKANRTAAIVRSLYQYYAGYYDKFWRKKTGILRRHLISTRSYFSFRAVITQINIPHNYDELHVPWGVGLTVLRPHIINRLVRKGYTLTDAIRKLYAAIYKYDQELHGIMDALIAESSFVSDAGTRGLGALICRNPSMKQGSIQRVVISRVKTSVGDNTISFSIMIAKSKNADFDGDEENVILTLDKDISEKTRSLAPHHNTIGPDTPLGVSGFLFLPKPTVATMANWLEHEKGAKVMSNEDMAKLENLAYSNAG